MKIDVTEMVRMILKNSDEEIGAEEALAIAIEEIEEGEE